MQSWLPHCDSVTIERLFNEITEDGFNIGVFTYSHNLSNGTAVFYCCRENLYSLQLHFTFSTSLGYQKTAGLEGKSREITKP